MDTDSDHFIVTDKGIYFVINEWSKQYGAFFHIRSMQSNVCVLHNSELGKVLITWCDFVPDKIF